MATKDEVLEAIKRLDDKFTAYIASKDAKHKAELGEIKTRLEDLTAAIPVEAAAIE